MPDLPKFADRIFARKRLMLIALGALSAVGFAPLRVWPLTLLAVAGLIVLLARTKSGKSAFITGWLFGLGHFTVGNYWIATAFTHQAQMPHWLGSIAVVLLAVYLAVYPALATAAAWLLVHKWGGRASSVAWTGAALVPAWIITEWLRAWVFTGFAWNPLGIALQGGFGSQGLAVLAPWIGTYALSGLLVAIAALLAALLWPLDRAKLRPMAFAGAVAIALALVIELPSGTSEAPEGARAVTLVQPDIRQARLDDPQYYEANYQKLARLSRAKRANTRRIVLWPESGLADYLREGYEPRHYRQMNYAADPVAARERIGRDIAPLSLLLTGAVDLDIEDGRALAARNSITALDWNGRILAGYSKAHLVPYGEYLPMKGLLEPLGLTRLVAGNLEFLPGPGPRTYDFGLWGKAGMQICYEIVFSGEVVDPAARPDYIFNPSNDGWFGAWGPPQHLAQARLRAAEEGLPVLRATTTGISAVIDARGLVRAHIPMHREGRLDTVIPPPAEPTLFSRFGNAIPVGLAFAILAVLAVAIRRGRS